MVITYYGLSATKVQFGETVLAFNPVSKKSAVKTSAFGADIALVSKHHPDYNGVEAARYGAREPFVVDGPGEYEVGGVYVRGYGQMHEGVINTIYSVLLEGINLCHLGALHTAELQDEVAEALGEIDVLFVPVYNGTLTASMAAKVATALEPKLIVPLHQGVDAVNKKELQQFLKEIGGEGAAAQEKLTLKRKDLEGKEGEVVIVAAQI